MDDGGEQVNFESEILDFLQDFFIVDVPMFHLHHQGQGLRLAVTIVGMIELDVRMITRKEIDEAGTDREFADAVCKIGSDRQQQNAYRCTVLEYLVADHPWCLSSLNTFDPLHAVI